jgi:hypothetical protein
MAFWSGERLSERLNELVEPVDPSKIDCASYTLRVGFEIQASLAIRRASSMIEAA